MEKYIIGHHILLIMSKGHLGYVVLQGLNLTIAVWKKCNTVFERYAWCYATIDEPSKQINVTK